MPADMECKFSLPVSKQIWLIDQPKSTACIPYLCGMRAADTDVMESINLCMVSESQPEKRLKTLLSKKMLIEAEVSYRSVTFTHYARANKLNSVFNFSGIRNKIQT